MNQLADTLASDRVSNESLAGCLDASRNEWWDVL